MKRTFLLGGLALLLVALGGFLCFNWTKGSSWDHSFVQDELLTEDVLATTDWTLAAPKGGTGKEISTPTNIDGQAGQFCQGWYANGKPRYEEHWRNGKQHGEEIHWDEQGQKVEERHWRSGYWHGPAIRWYPDGTTAEQATYDRYRLDGAYRTWHRNGQPFVKAEYQKGNRQGDFLAWHPNGARDCQATFNQDRLEGTWQKWDAEGNLLKRIEYREGEIVADRTAKPIPFVHPGPLGAADFAFVLAQGSGWHGFSTLRASASGRCEFSYYLYSPRVSRGIEHIDPLPAGEIYETQQWRKAQFQLTDEMQKQLREAIEAAHLFDLQDEYIDRRVADGTQWNIRLRVGGQEKRIYCSNSFPEPLRQLSRAIREQIMIPHRMELLTASGSDSFGSSEVWLED